MKTTTEYSISIDRARINLEDQLLSPYSLYCHPGELLYLYRRESNHCSPIIKSLYGTLPISEGHAQILGTDVVNMSKAKLAELRKRVSIINRKSYLINHLSIKDNAELFIALVAKNGTPDTSYLEDLLASKLMNAKKKVKYLSEEDQLRFQMALGLLHQPAIFLIEDKLDSHDFELRSEIMSMLIQKARNKGMSIIITTDSPALIDQFPGRIYKDDQRGKVNLTLSA